MWNKKFWKEGPGSFALAILLALTIRWGFMEAYVIPSGSMLPTLLVNDHIFVNKFIYGLRLPFTEKWMVTFKDPQRGEVIVFRYPENENLFYIKRVIGVGGDKVFYENGNLFINDNLIDKNVPQETLENFGWLRDEDFSEMGLTRNDYIHWEESLQNKNHSILLQKEIPSRTFGPYMVPKGGYFVMGDNRDNSRDSRLWAPDKRFVKRNHLIGRAMFVWLSCEETLPVLTFLCNPLTIRAKRFFHSVR